MRFLLGLSLILSTGCAGLQTVTSEMECALEGKAYDGYHKTGATVTDVTHYESSTEIRTAPEYAHYCRPPKTQAEKVEINKLKSEAQKIQTHQLIGGLSATVVMVAILGAFFWWADK